MDRDRKNQILVTAMERLVAASRNDLRATLNGLSGQSVTADAVADADAIMAVITEKRAYLADVQELLNLFQSPESAAAQAAAAIK